jgi:membrane protein EpsK
VNVTEPSGTLKTPDSPPSPAEERLPEFDSTTDAEACEEAVEAASTGDRGFVVPAASPPTPPRGRLAVNLITNIGVFGFNVLIGVWYTPYLIRHLGTDAYGIIPLISQITSYMIIVTATLNSATNRYVTIALEQNDDEEANRYFNTALFGSALLVLLLIPVAVWAAVDLGSIVNIPAGQEAQTRWLFVCTAAGFFLGALQSPFGVSCFCRNRFDLQNLIGLVQQIVRVGLVVVFFSILAPQIWHVGVAALTAMFFGWGWSIRFWRRLTPTLTISLAHFSRRAFQNLFSMGGWVAVNYLGVILYVSIDLLVVNRMFGTEAGGRYAAVLQWSTLLRMLVGVVGTIFGPTMLTYYAQNDFDGLCRYGQQAVKLVGLLMGLPIALICGFSTPLLQTWLGPTFTDMTWLMTLMTAHLSFNLAVTPLLSVQNVANRVRTPAIVTVIMGFGNLGLAILLAGPMGWGLYGVAAAGAIALTMKNFVFTPLYAAHILHRRLGEFLHETAPIIVATVGTAAACKLLSAVWDVSGWFHLAAFGALVSVAYAVVAYFVLLNREERLLAWSMVPKRIAIGRGK